MKPLPTTPMRRTFWPRAIPAGTPSSFLSAVVAKKISTRRRDTSVIANSPNACASASRPRFIPCSSEVRTTSSARSGAG
jgi:hypothetical protein